MATNRAIFLCRRPVSSESEKCLIRCRRVLQHRACQADPGGRSWPSQKVESQDFQKIVSLFSITCWPPRHSSRSRRAWMELSKGYDTPGAPSPAQSTHGGASCENRRPDAPPEPDPSRQLTEILTLKTTRSKTSHTRKRCPPHVKPMPVSAEPWSL